jgi:hypothetical protein
MADEQREMDMEISNAHNLVHAPDDGKMRFGIRVTLAESDPFRRLLPDQWEKFHWYPDAAARDRALAEMRARHRYSRMGDEPTVSYEPTER